MNHHHYRIRDAIERLSIEAKSALKNGKLVLEGFEEQFAEDIKVLCDAYGQLIDVRKALYGEELATSDALTADPVQSIRERAASHQQLLDDLKRERDINAKLAESDQAFKRLADRELVIIASMPVWEKDIHETLAEAVQRTVNQFETKLAEREAEYQRGAKLLADNATVWKGRYETAEKAAISNGQQCVEMHAELMAEKARLSVALSVAEQLSVFAKAYRSHPNRNPSDDLDAVLASLEAVRTGDVPHAPSLLLKATFAPMKFADTVRRYHDGDSERFIFSDRTGHVHGEYRKGSIVSPAPESAIGAVKIGEAWFWVIQPGDLPEQPDTECHGLDTPHRVCFYEQDFYVLSNFSSFSVSIEGRIFPTSEHAYHWFKFNDTERSLARRIETAPSAHEAFKLAEAFKHLRRPDWDDVKVHVMRRILRAKVEQHEYVRRKLLATGNRELVENSWRDTFWGWGPNRDGQNILGKLWMELRAWLRTSGAGEKAATAGSWTPSAEDPDNIHDKQPLEP